MQVARVHGYIFLFKAVETQFPNPMDFSVFGSKPHPISGSVKTGKNFGFESNK